jgi:TonB family protein
MAGAVIALPVHAAAQQSCDVVHRTDAFEFSGRVHAGEAYQCQFSPVLSFALVPTSGGWLIEVHEKNRDENLARLTPENNGINPLLVEFSPSHSTVAAESERMATEQKPIQTEFIFSPEVGRSLGKSGRAPTGDEIRQASEQGKGVFKITKMRVGQSSANSTLPDEALSFEVSLRLGGRALLDALAYSPGSNPVGARGIKAPKATFAPAPDYPEHLRGTGAQGQVILWMIVDEKGMPKDVKVARSLSPELDAKAIEAVKRWRFQPATKDGKPVAVQINVEVEFRLNMRIR